MQVTLVPDSDRATKQSAGMLQCVDDVVKAGLCIGCGVCAYSDAIGAMQYSHKQEQYVPVLTDGNGNDAFGFALCPGKGYNIIADSQGLFDEARYDLELGYVYSHCAAFSNDREVMANASSGGMMTQIAIFLLESGIVDRVLVTDFTYGPAPRAACILAKSRSEILGAQGSKYCPVDLSNAVREIKNNSYKVAVLGTPCQIAGIRNIQKNDAAFCEKVVMTIATFCGGVKSYRNVDLLARRHGIDPKGVTFFRFRGNGQPGSMLIRESGGRAAEVPYPQYVGHTGLSKHLRCHLCVDATGELADIACGDAWVPRFLKSPNAWSVVIARSRRAADLIETMAWKGIITTAGISLEEIKSSQRENLRSKKVRQKSRRRLYRALGFTLPSFDGGYDDNGVSIALEVKVLLKHRVKELLEDVRLFVVARRAAKWVGSFVARSRSLRSGSANFQQGLGQ